MDLESQIMGIIVNAGHGRSLCYESLNAAKSGDFIKAEELIDQSREALSQAHLIQTQLIEADEGMGKTPMTLVMVHAQDHLMTSILCKELVIEMIDIHKKFRKYDS